MSGRSDRDSQVFARHARPLWVGGLVAPLTAPSLLCLGSFAWLAIAAGLGGFGDWYVGLLGVMAVGLPLSYAGMWLLGMPFVLYLRRTGRLSALNVCISAMLAGSITFVCVQRLSHADWSAWTSIGGIVVGSIFGLPTGLVFCWVTGLWRRDRVMTQEGQGPF